MADNAPRQKRLSMKELRQMNAPQRRNKEKEKERRGSKHYRKEICKVGFSTIVSLPPGPVDDGVSYRRYPLLSQRLTGRDLTRR